MKNIGQVAQLKEILLGMERDLNLGDLGRIEKNILYAATLLAEQNEHIDSEHIRAHGLMEGVPRSSFFRALKRVIEAGYLAHLPGTQRSAYRLTGKPV